MRRKKNDRQSGINKLWKFHLIFCSFRHSNKLKAVRLYALALWIFFCLALCFFSVLKGSNPRHVGWSCDSFFMQACLILIWIYISSWVTTNPKMKIRNSLIKKGKKEATGSSFSTPMSFLIVKVIPLRQYTQKSNELCHLMFFRVIHDYYCVCNLRK